jgi:hypothetical protein
MFGTVSLLFNPFGVAVYFVVDTVAPGVIVV